LSPEQRRAEIPELQAELSPEFEARTKGAIKRHIARLNSRRRLWQPRNTASPTSSPQRWTAPLNGCVVSSRNALTGSAAYKIDPAKDARLAWRTFLRNHAPDIAAMDLFVAPTIGFDLLYLLVIVRLERRKLVWINVTPHPTAEWIARQVTEAFPWDEAPRYLIRDRDRAYGAAFTDRLRAMGIRDKPIAPGSPWQNGFAERLIGSIRRECVDHIVVLSEAHMRRILTRYAAYHNELRSHRTLGKDPHARFLDRKIKSVWDSATRNEGPSPNGGLLIARMHPS
jgi:transposase InsO family protein